MKRERARFWGAFAVAVVLALAGITAAARWHRLFPTGEVSELYRAYMDTPGIDATFIRGFQVNDTLSVDVTLLQATDSAGWATLLGNVRMSEELEEDFKLFNHEKKVVVQSFPKGHPGLPPDPAFLNNDILAVDWAEETISIFHITDTKQLFAILGYHLDIVKNRKTQQK